MTTTEADLERRLRRDLAELGSVPVARARELQEPGRRRPAVTVSVALFAVLALVAASFAIVRGTDHRRPAVAPVPRVNTILEQPSAVTGSASSILAHRNSQVCEKWRELPEGVDCSDLQARYVWSPGATNGPYTFSVIEVVGRPDLKLQHAPNPTYPVFRTVIVDGHRARLFGTAQTLTLLWQERPDLQVFVSASVAPSAARYSGSLLDTLVAFADGMHPVAVDPTLTQYVLTGGTTPIEYADPHTIRDETWDLSWRPRDRRLCLDVGVPNDCLGPVEPDAAGLWVKNTVVVEDCPQPWIGTQGLVFGAASGGADRVDVGYTQPGGRGSRRLTLALVSPPGEPAIRVFAVALDHPSSAAVLARDHAGRTLARATLPPFRFTCSS